MDHIKQVRAAVWKIGNEIPSTQFGPKTGGMNKRIIFKLIDGKINRPRTSKTGKITQTDTVGLNLDSMDQKVVARWTPHIKMGVVFDLTIRENPGKENSWYVDKYAPFNVHTPKEII